MNAKVHQVARNSISKLPVKEPAAPVVSELGKGIKATVDGDKLTLEIDLSQDFGKSTSGKTTIIATTAGNVAIPGATNGATLGLNLYRK